MDIRTRRTKKILGKRRNKRVFSGVLLSFGIMFFLIIVSTVILRADYFSLNNIKIIGDQESSHKDILTIVETEIEKGYLKIFPKNSYLLFPKDKIKTLVYNSFKEIERVDFNFDGFNSVNLVIKARKPFALWCNEKESCYFVDENGFIYTKAPNFSGSVFLKYYGGVVEEVIGSSFLNKDEFKKISFFLKSLDEDLLLKPVSFTDKEDEYQINLDKNLNNRGFRGGKILLNKKDDFGEIFIKLKTIIENNTVSEDVFQKEVELDYIDLRFGNKIYYKFK